MKYISFLRDDEIVEQFAADKVNQEIIIDLDEMLRKVGILKENEEVAVTQSE